MVLVSGCSVIKFLMQSEREAMRDSWMVKVR
jgi:hypothetical protein